LPTQIHERYLVPALVSLAIALVLQRRLWRVYGLLGLGVLLNIVYLFPADENILRVARVLSGEGIVVVLVLCLVAMTLVWMEVRKTGPDHDGASREP
jgi:hypothetical protein